MIKLAIIDDDDFIREEFKTYFDNHPLFECTVAVDSAEKLLKYVQNFNEFDIVLVDIGLPGMSGLNLIKHLHTKNANIEIVVLTVQKNNDTIFQALCKGANHYLLKGGSLDNLANNLLKVSKGETILSPSIARRIVSYFHPTKQQEAIDMDLSPKEFQVVKFIVDGLSYKMIAANMGISTDGVRYYIRKIYKKLQVNSKTEVIKRYRDGFTKLKD